MLASQEPTSQNLITIKHDETRAIAIEYYMTMIDIVRKNSWFEMSVIETIVHCVTYMSERREDKKKHDHLLGSPQNAVDILKQNRDILLAA